MHAKQEFFAQVLGGLKERSAYFSRDAIQAAADGVGLELKRSTLSVYLNQAVKQGLIHDAGRGWYSRLAEPVKLDLHMGEAFFPDRNRAGGSVPGKRTAEPHGPGGIPPDGAESPVVRPNQGFRVGGLRHQPEKGLAGDSWCERSYSTSPFCKR